MRAFQDWEETLKLILSIDDAETFLKATVRKILSTDDAKTLAKWLSLYWDTSQL